MNNLNETVTDLMHRATVDLEPESPDLFERGLRRGLTLRRRRAALRTFAGAGAVLASVAVVGGGFVLASEPGGEPPAAGRPAGPVSGSASVSGSVPGTAATPDQALRTLKALLPDSLRVTRPQLSQDPSGTITVSVLANDGKGPSEVSVQLGADNGPVDCRDKPANRCRIRPDGSVITVGGSRPGVADQGLVNRHVVVRHRNGSFIGVVNTNTTSSTARPTRPQPVLSVAQLTTIADSLLWKFPPKPAGR